MFVYSEKQIGRTVGTRILKKHYALSEANASRLAFLLIALSSIIAYANSFQVPFVFDDHHYILDNPVIQNRAWGELWAYSPQRFIGFLSFMANIAISGNDPFSLHLVNLMIHILNGFLVYAIISELLVKVSINTSKANLLALFFALVFVVHPIQTQAVTYIWQRVALLSAFFSLCSIYAFLIFLKEKRILPYVLSIICICTAQFTKQNAFTMPIVIAALDFFYDRHSPFKKRLFRLSPILASMAIIPLMLTFDQQLRDLTAGKNVTDPLAYFLSQPYVIVAIYFRIILLPINQVLDYGLLPLAKPFSGISLLSIAFLSMLFVTGLVLMYRRHIIGLGIFSFFMLAAVESSFLPLDDLVFEHRMYLPLFGLLIASAGCVDLILRTEFIKGIGSHIGHRKFLIAMTGAAVLYLIALSSLTFARNHTWNSEKSIYLDIIAKRPDNWRAHSMLGDYYFHKGADKKAEESYRYAVNLNPNEWATWDGLGRTLAAKMRFTEALSCFEKAMHLTGFATPRANYALTLIKLGKIDQAEAHAKQALAQDPQGALSLMTWAALLQAKGHQEMAGQVLEQSWMIHQGMAKPVIALAEMYVSMQQKEKALAALKKVRVFKNSSPRDLNTLAQLANQVGDQFFALKLLESAMETTPEYQPTYQLISEILLVQGYPEQARRIIEIGRNAGAQ